MSSDSYHQLDVATLEKLREIQRRNLSHLTTQAAGFGELYVPIHIVNQIDSVLATIAALNAELSKRGVAGNDPTPGTPVGTVINHYHGAVTQHNQTISASGGSTISGVNQVRKGGAGGDQTIAANDHGAIKDVEQRSE